MPKKIELSIDENLHEKLEAKSKETNFESVEAYILFILEQILSGETENEKAGYTEEEEKAIHGHQSWDEEPDKKKTYTAEEEEALKKNLKDLGYI